MRKFVKKWHGKSVEDAITCTSKEFNSFANQFYNALKREFPNDEIVNRNKGHYDLSCFLKHEDEYVYISYSVPRGEKPIDMTRRDPLQGILFRRARDENDYRGESNHFTSFIDLKDDIEKLL